MIRDRIKIHSNQSFEIKLEFPANDVSIRKTEFGMDMFLFLPPALDVNKHNYTRHDFYRTLKSYIRMTTPIHSFEEMSDIHSDFNKKFHDGILESVLHNTGKNQNRISIKIKRNVCITNHAISDEVKRILLIRDDELQIDEAKRFTHKCTQLRKWYSTLVAQLLTKINSEQLRKTIILSDEYQSLMLESQLHNLANGLSHKISDKSDTMIHIFNLVLEEMKYRKRVKYLSVGCDKKSNEAVLHRKGRVKRYVESNLFLNTDTLQEGVFYEQLFFSLAAGLAMIFATSVAFATQQAFGNFTLPFFIALVISYMFKDRIKELSRMYFDKQRKKMFFDFRTTISMQKNIKIGVMREIFRFEKLQYLPDNIRDAREKMRVTDISEEWIGDKVIHYKTKIRINEKRAKQLDNFCGLTQILRLNITPFAIKMDEHEQEVFIKSKKHIKRQTVNRLYHLNLIFRFTSGKKETTKYYKLVTDKMGIKRIDRIEI